MADDRLKTAEVVQGEIVRFRCKRGERMHTVQYDDGDVEEHDLSEGGGERWVWLPGDGGPVSRPSVNCEMMAEVK